MTLDEENDIDVKTAIVPVPSVLPDCAAAGQSGESRHDFMFLEQVLCHFAARLFIGFDLLEAVLSALPGMPI